jgi:hypothetical protein
MNNPKYAVTINYFPKHRIGTQEVSSGGITHSVPEYNGDFFIASMPEVSISATGSTYEESLDNLLIIANEVDGNGSNPLNNIRNW